MSSGRDLRNIRKEIESIKDDFDISPEKGFTKKERAIYSKDPVLFAYKELRFKGRPVRLSLDQQKFIAAMYSVGYRTAICETWESARNAVLEYLLAPGAQSPLTTPPFSIVEVNTLNSLVLAISDISFSFISNRRSGRSVPKSVMACL